VTPAFGPAPPAAASILPDKAFRDFTEANWLFAASRLSASSVVYRQGTSSAEPSFRLRHLGLDSYRFSDSPGLLSDRLRGVGRGAKFQTCYQAFAESGCLDIQPVRAWL
jgi:hypothetical protein